MREYPDRASDRGDFEGTSVFREGFYDDTAGVSGHIDSAENKDRRHINSNEIHGPSLRDQKIRAAGNRKKTDQDRHKKCQKILKCPRKVKCVVIISPAEARNMIGLK